MTISGSGGMTESEIIPLKRHIQRLLGPHIPSSLPAGAFAGSASAGLTNRAQHPAPGTALETLCLERSLVSSQPLSSQAHTPRVLLKG